MGRKKVLLHGAPATLETGAPSQAAAPPKAGVWKGGAGTGVSTVQLAEPSDVFKAGKEQGHWDAEVSFMEKDFRVWYHIGDNMLKHVIMDRVNDKSAFRLEGDGGPGESDFRQMTFDMSTGEVQAGALGSLFSIAADDSAVWNKIPRKIGIKMVRL